MDGYGGERFARVCVRQRGVRHGRVGRLAAVCQPLLWLSRLQHPYRLDRLVLLLCKRVRRGDRGRGGRRRQYAYATTTPGAGTDSRRARPRPAMHRAALVRHHGQGVFTGCLAYSIRGGDDLGGAGRISRGGNRFYGYANYGTLSDSAGSFYHYASGFAELAASAASSGNAAYLYGSNGNDVLTARPAKSSSTGPPASLTVATGFEQVYAYASGGGLDRACTIPAATTPSSAAAIMGTLRTAAGRTTSTSSISTRFSPLGGRRQVDPRHRQHRQEPAVPARAGGNMVSRVKLAGGLAALTRHAEILIVAGIGDAFRV